MTRVRCLGQCHRRPAEVIYRDGAGVEWGLCGRRACAERYNGTRAGADVRAGEDVRAAEEKPATKANAFVALLRKREG